MLSNSNTVVCWTGKIILIKQMWDGKIRIPENEKWERLAKLWQNIYICNLISFLRQFCQQNNNSLCSLLNFLILVVVILHLQHCTNLILQLQTAVIKDPKIFATKLILLGNLQSTLLKMQSNWDIILWLILNPF